jgi:hypothetical protein
MFGKQVFLTEQDRRNHAAAYRRGETHFASPYEPWVIETWQRASDRYGWAAIAKKVKGNIMKFQRKK